MLSQVADAEQRIPLTHPTPTPAPTALSVADIEHASVIRGVRNALLLSLPFWALVAFGIYWLI